MKKEYYQNKSANYGIGHTRLKRIIYLAGSVQGKSVLDIGCARGYLGRLLKEKGALRVEGIDISEGALVEANKVLDQTYALDLEGEWPEELKAKKFDVIIMAEVLEHVFDPVKVLKNVQRVLKDGGIIIITTPNFMTWTNRVKFIFGDFQYQDQGMFDFGHIRWFTHEYLKKVLRDSGFKIVEEKNIIFPGKLTKILKFWPSLFAFQFILKAKKI